MEIFTYEDYLKYQKFLEENAESVTAVQEDSEIYIIENNQVNHEHDKI